MITQVDGQDCSSPVLVVPPPVRAETWSDHEVSARIRAAQARGATRSIFRPLQDGVLLTTFALPNGRWSLRVTGTSSFLPPDSLARLALPLVGPPDGGAAAAVFMAIGSAVAKRSVPPFELAVAPLYRFLPNGKVLLVPLPGDVSVPIKDTPQAAAALAGMHDDGLGLRSPQLGYLHFLVGAGDELTASAAGGVLSVRHMAPQGFCARFGDDFAMQLAALQALRMSGSGGGKKRQKRKKEGKQLF